LERVISLNKMIENKDYYRWMCKTNDNKIYFTDSIKLSLLIPPYSFALVDGFKVISEVEINEGEERIYFKRVFNSSKNQSKTHVLKILYCIGKKVGEDYFVDIINPENKEIIKYNGKNLDEVCNIKPGEMS
jgi:hypothetical protein